MTAPLSRKQHDPARLATAPDTPLSDPVLLDRLFTYQHVKRLHLLIDQILWSWDCLAEPASGDAARSRPAQLRDMLWEAKDHVMRLERQPEST